MVTRRYIDAEVPQLYAQALRAIDKLRPNVVEAIRQRGPWIWKHELQAMPDREIFWYLVDCIDRLECCLGPDCEPTAQHASDLPNHAGPPWWSDPECEAIEQRANRTSGDAGSAWLTLTRGVLWESLARLDAERRADRFDE